MEGVDPQRPLWRLSYAHLGKPPNHRFRKQTILPQDSNQIEAQQIQDRTDRTRSKFSAKQGESHLHVNLTSDDVEDIQQLITEFDNTYECSEPDIGWMSPLKAKSPMKRSQNIVHQQDPPSSSQSNKENKQPKQKCFPTLHECHHQDVPRIQDKYGALLDNQNTAIQKTTSLHSAAEEHANLYDDRSIVTLFTAKIEDGTSTNIMKPSLSRENWAIILSPEIKEKLSFSRASACLKLKEYPIGPGSRFST